MGARLSGARRLERLAIRLVALRSAAVGAGLLLLTDLGGRMGGFSRIEPHFFAHQGGAFHFVVVAAYLIEHYRYDRVTILLTAKAIAVVFLTAETLGGAPWIVPVSAVADGLMGLGIFFLHRRGRSNGQPRLRPLG